MRKDIEDLELNLFYYKNFSYKSIFRIVLYTVYIYIYKLLSKLNYL